MASHESPGSSVVIVPRWAGRPSSDWYPWLAGELAARAPGAVTCLDMPDPDCPVVGPWTERIAGAVGGADVRMADTYLIGHSVGCMAVLHFLAGLPPGVAVAGTLLVAGWWDIDAPWDTIRPWLDAGVDVDRARAAAGPVRVLISDNDPFTADWRATRDQWRARIGAAVTVEPGGRHFNGAQEPAVLREVLALLS